MVISLLLILGLGYAYYLYSNVDDQIQFEIEKLNLPVDSITVEYEAKKLHLESFDLKKVLFSKSTLENPKVIDSKMEFANISVTGVQWWKLYKKEVLEADTILIEGVAVHISDNIISQILYNSTVPIQKVRAKVLIIKGDTISHQLTDRGVLQIGNFQLEKKDIDVDLKALDFQSLSSAGQYSIQNVSFKSENNSELIACGKIRNESDNHFIENLDFKSEYASLFQNDLVIEGLALEDFWKKDKKVIKSIEVLNKKGLQVNDLGFTDKYISYELFENYEIESLIIKGDRIALEHQEKDNNFKLTTAGYQISKANVNFNDLANLWKRWKVKAENINMNLDENSIDFFTSNLRLQSGKCAIERGNFNISSAQNSSSNFDFNSIILWEQDLINNMLNGDFKIDSISMAIVKADIHENNFQGPGLISNDLFSQFSIGKIDVEGNNLKLRSNSYPSIFVNAFLSQITDIKQTSDEKIAIGDFSLNMSDIQSTSRDKSRKYDVNKVKLKKDRIFLEDIQFTSNKSKAITSNTTVAIRIPMMDLLYSDFNNYIENEILDLDELVVNQLDIVVNTDENRFTNDKYKAILSESLMNFSIPMDIARLKIRKSRLQFKYRPLKDESFSEIYFNNLELDVFNVCNIRNRLNAGSLLKIEGDASFMGKAPFQIDATFKLLDPNAAYVYKIELGTIEFSEINDLLTDLAGLKIKKGRLDKLLCNVNADKYQSKGTLDFYYRNLKVRYDKDKFIEKWNPVNFMITRFVLDQDNRQEWEHETGKIDVKRDQNKSMYFQIWEAIFSGMKYVMMPVI